MTEEQELHKEMMDFFHRSLETQSSIVGSVPSRLDVRVEERKLTSNPFQHDDEGVKTNRVVEDPKAPPVPTVIEVFGRNGNINGGTPRLIQGTDFADGCQVRFEDDIATEVEVVTPEYLRCVVPATTEPLVDGRAIVNVRVANIPGNTNFEGELDDGFTYYRAPSISSVSPNTGPGSGGTSVSLTGNWFHFQSGYKVYFGGSTATSVNRIGDTQITCVTPPHPEGVVSVIVKASDYEEQLGVLGNGFTYGSPPGTTEGPVTIRRYINGQPSSNYPLIRTGQTTTFEFRTGTILPSPPFSFVHETTWNGTIKLKLQFYLRQGQQFAPSSLEVSVNGTFLPHNPFFEQEIFVGVTNGVGVVHYNPNVVSYPPNTFAGTVHHNVFWSTREYASAEVHIGTP